MFQRLVVQHLKYFISENEQKTIPPLQHNGTVVDDNIEKANVLNNFFRDQTILPDQPSNIPTIPPYTVSHSLDSITLNEIDIRTLLSNLPLGKASGPDGVNNRIQ